MVNWLLTEPEKHNIADYERQFEDNSLSSRVLDPFWNFVVRLIPNTVAPNILSLAGLMCTIQAWYACVRYMDAHPREISILAALLLFAYQTLDAIDGKQARRTRNESPLGELFDLACDGGAVVFVSLVMCEVLSLTDVSTQWYIVQSSCLLWMSLHIAALKSGMLRFGLLSGPGELIFLFQMVLLIRATFGLNVFYEAVSLVRPYYNVSNGPRDFYYAMIAMCSLQSLRLKQTHTRNAMLFCVACRTVPALLLYFGWTQMETGLIEVIADGGFVGVITTDLIVCKMSGRDFHPWVLIAVMFSMFSYLLTFAIITVYYLVLFFELATFLGLPMFSLCVNVYVDGVYDMCHVGHHNIFTNALQFGNRLFVGVLSDASVASYKRKPIMTEEERIAVVSTCKGVYKVVPDAPFPGIPMEFIKKFNIHVVCHSPEYTGDDDIYYKVPRKMGITRVLPRTEGISTSALIRRVKAYQMPEKKKKDN